MSRRDVLQEFPFLLQIIAHSRSMLAPEKIVLFGSRARGDHRELSDVDIAFSGVSPEVWTRFVVDFSEHSGSLLNFDLVNLDTAPDELARNIQKEGITIYERQNLAKSK